MTSAANLSTGSTREAILAAVTDLAEQAGEHHVIRLVDRVLEHVATEDLAEREPRDLHGMVRSMWALAQQREAEATLVRVFTPTVDDDGWQSKHTIVQICTDDMPFLVDSVTAALSDHGRVVYLIVHPQLVVRRDATGALTELRDERPPTAAGTVESWMHIAIDRIPTETARSELTDRLEAVLGDVRRAVADWTAMRHACEAIASQLEAGVPPTVDPAEVEPAERFLRWLVDDHFTFLGYREYDLDTVDGEDVLRPVAGSGLGILRGEPDADHQYSRLRPEARENAREPRLLTITKANSRATVHRPVYLDYIGIRTFDADGNVTGERRFLGMFTSTAYADSVLRLPIAAEKVRAVLARSGFAAHSHSAKDLLGVLEAYPRDELLQTDVDTLWDVASDVLYLQERRKAKLFLRKDEFGRFVSALVYIPRDRYNTVVRLRMESILTEAYGAEHVDFTTRVSESPLAQLHFVVRVPRDADIPEVDTAAVQEQLLKATRTWEEDLLDALHVSPADDVGAGGRFVHGFPEAYKEDFDADTATHDLAQLQGLTTGDTRVHLYDPDRGDPTERRLKVYRREPLSLTDMLPTFSDLGVVVADERPYTVRDDADGSDVRIYDFGLRAPSADLWAAGADTAASFEDAFLAVRTGHAESDGLNALVLRAGLTWRQVVILRTVARYLRQIGSTFSVEYLEAALVANPVLAARVVALFEARFDPDSTAGAADRDAAQARITAEIDADLEQVASLDQDRIVRAFVGVIAATLRTNYFRSGAVDDDGQPAARVSLKLDCHLVPGLPSPKPRFEIWVYSPQVEGVHLRFGAVARGGLRWSDRREDFRTEVLGLVKAQMVKNAVIVPTGSKGGFFAKQLPDPTADRAAWLAEGRSAYSEFIRGLLDVTDNRVGTTVVPPERVVRHDGDDPYLVVAADKGTAAFSDLANSISAEYGFWLDDAFASGGSAGYDHKEMGITARGAWESTKRHFREVGLDTQSQDFTVVGIGDMSGDVFGNGMLLSEHIRLVAAFDHRDVFIDPTPDAAASFAERRRLFDLPRSSWADYAPDLISTGGGVFSRSAKSVPVSAEARAALGLADDVTSLTPAELIHAILLAPVDLVYNGGIGTYVKASVEAHSEIGDRANDAIRVDGRELRCQVLVEGGNLGVSQLGRIEAAAHGVRINTDAIDNSAGVGTSDREVNIKIALTALTRDGELTMDQRNELLASMTDEVAAQVLRDNYVQNVLLGNSRAHAHEMLAVHQRLIQWLEGRGELDRALEFLPTDAEIAERDVAGSGLTRPEFAVLVAYAKLALKADLADSGLADGPWFSRTLAEYFPAPLRQAYPERLAEHPLRREIIVNSVVNSMVNRGGITFAFRAADETGASSEQITRAFVASREIFALEDYVAQVEALDNLVDTAVQTQLYLDFRRLLDRASRWFVHHRPEEAQVGEAVEEFAGGVRDLIEDLPDLLRDQESARFAERADALTDAGVPAPLARRAAGLLPALSLLDVMELASTCGEDPRHLAGLYYALSARLRIDDLLIQVAALPLDNRWDALARSAMRDDLYGTLAALTRTVQAATDAGSAPDQRIAAWAETGGVTLTRAEESIGTIAALVGAGVAPVSVALRNLRALVR
ncbi:NAD-glutamate dehydrogenase [Occultella glacieicola]|uniref:NAD-glutamate dehydrogenase n=1 Tax=Occultella glacieicola TaxID=2518684 RepID=A0ABY2E4S4_9MICO|nr:NAD-glutamate dehydrogenase [Occultella glacieicola]TDE94891.1 NAD-glutamate dehydrogenase [Occultella glacieicola]